MKQGLLWYDNDPKKSLQDKLVEAARRYKEKYGGEPTTCYINPSHLQTRDKSVGALKVISAPTLLPNHFWLEIEK